jgi:hypothetical protein
LCPLPVDRVCRFNRRISERRGQHHNPAPTR